MSANAEVAARRLLETLNARKALEPQRPTSTYRLQLTDQFGFKEATALIPYLDALGVGALYLSPPFETAPGSTHGYDVVDQNVLRAALGGEAGFVELARQAKAHSLGLVIDFVPNHMGIDPLNVWWNDVLENGPSSMYASYFDIDWKPVKDELENRVLVPVLGAQFGEVLERGEIRLEREEGTFFICYYHHRFPLAPRALPKVLTLRLSELQAKLDPTDVHLQDLLSIVTAMEKIAPRSEIDAESVAERAREKEVAKRRLATLFAENTLIRDFVDENVRIINGKPGDPRSFDQMEELLQMQAYRLAHWRVAGEEINYRRFFDVNSLAAIRMENELVFDHTHALILRLLAEGSATGLRIDHPDGLYSPTAYFKRLQEKYVVECARKIHSEMESAESFEEVLPHLRALAPNHALYVVVEKILEGEEPLPSGWQVDGTTGYDFLCDVGGLFVDQRNRQKIDGIYTRFVGANINFRELTYQKKKQVMTSSISSELNMLAHRLNRISEGDRHTRDFTLNELKRALIEFIACLPIYRTYVEGDRPEDVDERDRRYIESTIAVAKRRSPAMSGSIFDFLRDILLLRCPDRLDDAQKRERIELVRNLQQITGSVMAKATEDTAFYVYNRLVSLNEVGCDPLVFGIDVEAFHRHNARRLERAGGSLTATSTHDTKRGEDVRLRISALSEIPEEWEQQLQRFAEINRPHLNVTGDTPVPDENEQLLLYQTLIGTSPDGGVDAEYVERMVAYMDKALKEAKVHTSWTNVDDQYHQAVAKFVRAILASAEFLDVFAPFARKIAEAAQLSSLSQVALKLIAPGVPDIYQGDELWDLSLVDPDNRRPVDFERRRRALRQLSGFFDPKRDRSPLLAELLSPSALSEGTTKLFVTGEGLRLRRRAAALFAQGDYRPLEIRGRDADRVIGFSRTHGNQTVAVIAPRFFLRQPTARDWQGEVVLPPDLPPNLVDLFSRKKIASGQLADCFRAFPLTIWATPDLL